MTRRNILKLLALVPAGIASVSSSAKLFGKVLQSNPVTYSETTRNTFINIMNKSDKGNWAKLDIGALMGKVAFELLNIPYVGGTLDSNTSEQVIIDLEGLDCVTFFENTLCMARIIKKGKNTFDDLINEVLFTRYRDGKLVDYTSRLHYTADWLYNNDEKHVVSDMTRKFNGTSIQFNLYFMSQNPQYYKQLTFNPDYINIMRGFEKQINKRIYFYITKAKAASAEKFLKTGDIIAITTSKKGLDYSHTGMIYVDIDNKAHFMHASSKKKKVILDKTISEYLAGIESDTGFSVVRPLEP